MSTKLTIECRDNPHTAWYEVVIMTGASFEKAWMFIKQADKPLPQVGGREYRIIES